MNLSTFATMFILAPLLFGCAHSPTVPPPTSLPPYTEPAPDEAAATFTGSTTTFFFQDDRTRVESIDGAVAAINGPKKAPTVRVRPGQHSMVLVRETQYNTGTARVQVTVQAVADHLYVVHAEEKSQLVNVGTKFWVEDTSQGGARIAEGEGWGATHGPFHPDPQ